MFNSTNRMKWVSPCFIALQKQSFELLLHFSKAKHLFGIWYYRIYWIFTQSVFIYSLITYGDIFNLVLIFFSFSSFTGFLWRSRRTQLLIDPVHLHDMTETTPAQTWGNDSIITGLQMIMSHCHCPPSDTTVDDVQPSQEEHLDLHHPAVLSKLQWCVKLLQVFICGRLHTHTHYAAGLKWDQTD